MRIVFSRALISPTQGAVAGWSCLLLTICLGAGIAALHGKTGVQLETRPSPNSQRAASLRSRREDPLWYYRSGQYRADTKSLVAAVRYLLEPEDSPADPACSCPPIIR